jgi:hypothetical protein
MKKLFSFLAAALVAAILPTSLQAEQVLLRQLPGTGIIGDYPDNCHAVALSEGVFVTYPDTGVDGASPRIARIVKYDASGNVLLNRTLSSILGESVAFEYQVRDVFAFEGKLYLCGNIGVWGFTARLNQSLGEEGFSLCTSTGFGSSITVRSVYTARVGTSVRTYVTGEFAGGTAGTEVAKFEDAGRTVKTKLTKTNNAAADGFVVQMDANLSPEWAVRVGIDRASAKNQIHSVACDPEGDVYFGLTTETLFSSGSFLWTEGSFNLKKRLGNGSENDLSNTSPVLSTPSATLPKSPLFIMKLDVGVTGEPSALTNFEVEAPSTNTQSSYCRDLVYERGYLFALTEYFGRSDRQGVDSRGKDVGIIRLNALNLRDHTNDSAFHIEGDGDDTACHLQVGEEGLYFSMIAAAGPRYAATLGGTLQEINSGSRRRAMWGRVSFDLEKGDWFATPGELVPQSCPLAAVAENLQDGNVLLFGAYANGDLSFGAAAVRATLPNPGDSRKAFVTVKTPAGEDALSVNLTVTSAYGTPLPAAGLTTIAKGANLTASVQPVIYKNGAGTVLPNPTDEQIRTQAVTRHVCTGYAVKDTVITGTTPYYSFIADRDTEVTFNWRTEYAVDVESDVAGSNGLTSTAAGNPEPQVQKHWIGEREQFTALVDGAASIGIQNGIRWRSTGYIAEGCVADAAAVASGTMVNWAAFQDRQQTPKITVGKPGRIVWKWQKEYSLRVAANSALASGAPYVDTAGALVPGSSVFTAATSVSGFPGTSGASAPTPGWPAAESPDMVNDGNIATKYLNFAKTNTGVILSYSSPLIANTLRLTTANDSAARDPSTVSVEGRVTAGAWVTLAASITVPPVGRNVAQNLTFTNSAAYNDYRITVLTVANATFANSTQVAELQLGRVIADSYLPGTRVFNGSGEHWAVPGTVLRAGSAPSVTGGLGSLALKGYTGGSGSVTPFDKRGITSVYFTLNSASSITWDYARTIHRETVPVGGFVTFATVTGVDANNANRLKAPAGGTVSQAPSSSTWGDMQMWDQVTQRLYVLRPGKFTVEFENSAAPEDVTQNVIIEITAAWPAADYSHIIEAPPVALDPSASDGRAFINMAYSEAAGTVDEQGIFSDTEPGRSVLVFSERTGGEVATGNLQQESLSIKVVDSLRWQTSAGSTRVNTPVGQAIVSAHHNAATVGHNGWVLTSLAPVNPSIYNPTTLQGPIIPVNVEYPNAGRWAKPEKPGWLAVAWYQVQDGLRWPYKAVAYNPQWPASPDRIVIASRLGSEGLKNSAGDPQTLFTAPTHNAVSIYNQPDPNRPGYNPNEEHAIAAPSFLNASRTAAFALRNDLNQSTADENYTSPPWVLVNYVDETDAANPVPKMAVYTVQHEDAAVTDTRLPAFNQHYTYFYEGEAGTKLTAPYPLELVIGATPQAASDAENVDPLRIAYYEDKTKQGWIISGDVDLAEDIRAVVYYPKRGDFWHPTDATGSQQPFRAAGAPAFNILYNTVWPADSGVLKAGETLTFSGGEYALDHAADTIKPKGLPGAVGWLTARVAFDEFDPSLDPSIYATSNLVRIVSPLESREVPLATAALPDDLKPASGNLIVEGPIWRFKKLHAGLQKRIYYNPTAQVLGVRGFLNGRTLGDPDLTAAPGAQTILQPNILTLEDLTAIQSISTNGTWIAAADALVSLSRDPDGVPATSFGVGLSATVGGTKPKQSAGPGLAVITNPRLLLPTGAPGGFVTIAENDDPALGDAPVVMHVFRVTRTEKYRGSLAPIYPENVFDEKITLRHTGDFGGDVSDIHFEWIYREEDGQNFNPPGVTLPTVGIAGAGDWQVFTSGTGKNEITLAGASAALLTDNNFFCRYRHTTSDGGVSSNWSQWAGAANSRPPVPASPSAATDVAYVPALVEGWIKRVTNAVNAFDARITDFRNNNAPATYTSMIQQAGQRFEGAVAFNPAKDVIENYGLIELYQTVLDRGKLLSVDVGPGTSGVNTALLNAANRIAGLYSLLGNEAYGDAVDPTIGYGTQSGEYGTLAPTIHCFQNQLGSLLEEEITLLRGRGETGARPAYNRLLWNFTNGQGEAAYALNYAISDLNSNGFLDVGDARRSYPQGHGDAWGHYTMALKGYYDLANILNFAWDPRSEKYQLEGNVFDIDYMDERAFAKAAAAKARCGTELVDLVYRQSYTENPNGQWQGYQDTNVDRAWGVFETAQRCGLGAYGDWLMGNALLKAEEADPLKTGIRKVDRTTVSELAAIAAGGAAVQTKLDQADSGLNPAGLDSDAVPFDIDPAFLDRANSDAKTHFEQVYDRAVAAAGNAVQTFDHANQISLQLRRSTASAESLRQSTADQDVTYRNRLIEIFGTPYAGAIGAGKTYPAGYNGPDLYLHMYVDAVDIPGHDLPNIPTTLRATQLVPGLRTLNADMNPFAPGDQAAPDWSHDLFSKYFPMDLAIPESASEAAAVINLNLPQRTADYAWVAPADWGRRASPGKLHAALGELLLAELDVRSAADGYISYEAELSDAIRHFEAKVGISAERVRISNVKETEQDDLHTSAIRYNITAGIARLVREGSRDFYDAFVEGIPTSLGLASDALAPIRGGWRVLYTVGATIARIVEGVGSTGQYIRELQASETLVELDVELILLDQKAETLDLLAGLQTLVRREPEARVAILQAMERMRAAGDRYRTVLNQGFALIDERKTFNERVASTTTKQRYEDYTFRVFHNEALLKYRSAFDLAARYAYLAGKAYQFELNLPDNHAANAAPLLAEMLRTRTLGQWDGGQPVLGQNGLADQLAILKTNFESMKGQLGFNNPATEVNSFSLRAELARIGLSSRVNATWRSQLETYRVPDLWNHQYQNSGVNYGYIFRRYCRPFAPESAGPQPALVIPFTSDIQAGKNWFGLSLAGGDSAFNASNFSTKIRAAGVRFDGYNNTIMSQTPQVYFVPVGSDRMFLPDSTALASRAWNVVDQRIPAPLSISPANLIDPNWRPFTGSTNGFFEEIRKFSSFRAYHDAGGYSPSEMLSTGRLVGRSVWNTQWVLIIPSASLLNEPADPDAGLDSLIYGAPTNGTTQATAGTLNRDTVGIRDIRILLQTYSISGN